MPKKVFGFPKNIFFLGLTSFFNDFSSEMVLSIFPAFFTTVLKTGAGSLGLVEGIADGAANIFKAYSGFLSDKLQKRKIFVVSGYTLSVLTRPFYLLANSVGAVMGLRFLDRVGKGLREAPRDAILSISADKGAMGASFGFQRALDMLGGILGPLVAYFILLYFPLQFDLVFVVAFVIGIFAIGTLFFIKDVGKVFKSEHFSLPFSNGKVPLRFVFFLSAMFFLSMGSMPIAVLLLKAEHIGLLIASIPLFYMIHNISSAAFSYIAGKTSDTVGARKVIVVGYSMLLLSYAIIGFADSAFTLGVGFFALGLFPALTDGVQRALAAELSPAELRGGAFGLLHATLGIGAIFAGVGGGLLWEFYSPEVALMAAALVLVMGLVLFVSSSLIREAGEANA
ncbi:MFS transporter [Patescibacteria group bacterium]|nr:MFS transporter [Patescibacteria group bacterium]